jgi:hypothetical protein
MRSGFGLLAEFRVGIPDRIAQDEHGLDPVLVRDGQELIDALEKTFAVLFPEEVMKIHPHGVHPHVSRPAQLAVDSFRIKGIGLPHFQLIDGRRGSVVATDQPGCREYHSLAFSADHRPSMAVW